jgi:hypothetical protein
MQVDSLQELVGSTVVKAEVSEDDLIVRFQNGACLTVYNRFQITDLNGSSGSDCDLLTGKLTELTNDHTTLRLTFSNGVKLIIDISEDGYSGPEALQLTRPGQPSIVWRIDD